MIYNYKDYTFLLKESSTDELSGYGYEIEDNKLLSILNGYLEAMLWIEEDNLREMHEEESESESEIDINIHNIEVRLRLNSLRDIRNFISMCGKEVIDTAINEQGTEQLGYDFWLTRDGQGAGFIDRGYDSNIEDILYSNAKKFKEIDISYENGKIVSTFQD